MVSFRSFLFLIFVGCSDGSARTLQQPTSCTEASCIAPQAPGNRLPDTWYFRDDHPVHTLFRRQESTNGVDYAGVGSPTWSAPYPTHSPDPSNLPQAWVDALNAAVSAGNIPDIPQSTMGPSGNPIYPDGLSPTENEVCSGTYQCRIDGDVWDAPDGVVGACFDDGPLPTSTKLYQFLQDQGIHATHFMIGVNIINNPDEFTMAFQTNGDDIAVHTWTHPYMTTLSNLQLLGEFGWTMQLIHNSTGGRLPRFWRPPYGDTDTRVHAIASEVFGLTTVMWNHDTQDWSLTTGGTNLSTVHTSLERWYSGSQSPGLIILEHELSNLSVEAYVDAFPLINQNGWDVVSVARMDGAGAYQNVEGDDEDDGDGGQVDETESVLAFDDSDASSLNASTTSTSTSTSSTGASPTTAVVVLHSISSSTKTSTSSTRSETAIHPSSIRAQKSSAALKYRFESIMWLTSLVPVASIILYLF